MISPKGLTLLTPFDPLPKKPSLGRVKGFKMPPRISSVAFPQNSAAHCSFAVL